MLLLNPPEALAPLDVMDDGIKGMESASAGYSNSNTPNGELDLLQLQFTEEAANAINLFEADLDESQADLLANDADSAMDFQGLRLIMSHPVRPMVVPLDGQTAS